jgi:hypothetical protein
MTLTIGHVITGVASLGIGVAGSYVVWGSNPSESTQSTDRTVKSEEVRTVGMVGSPVFDQVSPSGRVFYDDAEGAKGMTARAIYDGRTVELRLSKEKATWASDGSLEVYATDVDGNTSRLTTLYTLNGVVSADPFESE